MGADPRQRQLRGSDTSLFGELVDLVDQLEILGEILAPSSMNDLG